MSEESENIFARAAMLRAERERLGLSQDRLATLAGVTLRTQQNYESGRRAPDANYLAAIAAAGADVQYIITGERRQAAAEPKDHARLKLAIETVEEGLAETGRVMKPDKKADLIFAVYDMFSDDVSKKEKDRILRLVKTAV